MSFTIEKNRHIFACWAASRAAGVSPLCRFKVEKGKEILDKVFGEDGQKALDDSLKNNEKDFDKYHRELRQDIIITEIVKMKSGELMSHGVAAKLINLYFKTIYICGNYKNDEGIKFIHPPIDSLLLESLKKNEENNKELWGKYKWSKMDSEQYQEVIDGIRKLNLEDGLWSIEKYWKGHQ